MYDRVRCMNHGLLDSGKNLFKNRIDCAFRMTIFVGFFNQISRKSRNKKPTKLSKKKPKNSDSMHFFEGSEFSKFAHKNVLYNFERPCRRSPFASKTTYVYLRFRLTPICI